LEKWRTVLAKLDVEPLRRHFSIPHEISNEVLCQWLEMFASEYWTLPSERDGDSDDDGDGDSEM
jgi:hypothetical protein